MPSFDFFTAGALPAPVLEEQAAAAIAAEHFGLRVRARSLGSQQDANFLLTAADPDDGVVGVLKVSNGAFGPADIAAQSAAAELLAQRVEGLRVATTVPPSDAAGSDTGSRTLTLPSGVDVVARVLRYLPGGTLSGSGHLSPRTVAALGRLAGRVVAALGEFVHPALHRVLQWDLQHAERVVTLLAPCIPDDGLRARVQEATRIQWGGLQAVAAQLPHQAIHGDLTDDNVVCADADGVRLPDGVIDLGDLTRSWTVGELAVTVSSLLHHDGAGPATVLPAVAAFHAERPLSDAEIEALWPLVVLRGAVLVASGHQQVALDAANDYVSGNMEREQRIFDVASSAPSDVMTALVRAHLGLPVAPAQPPSDAGLLVEPLAAGESLEVLDLSSTADALDGGAWQLPDIEERLAGEALDAGAVAVVTAFGQGRLTRAVPLSASPPENVATGVDAWWNREVTLRAPWDGTVEDGGCRLRGHGVELSLRSTLRTPRARDGAAVRRGDALMTVPARTRCRITVRSVGEGDVEEVPSFVSAQMLPGWLAVVADPSALLGAPELGNDPAGNLLARRAASFATLQEHYYSAPPRIERGWREHLVDTDGRVYLDAVNNVAVLGHGHLGVADAVSRQLRRLNTNSRFHYSAVVEFSERLVALLPEPLDTVFLVNSGSEANDLALRIALATTGHRDLVAVGEAYHGWTYVSDAVSTSSADNPHAVGTRPAWVHTLDSPNPYRGLHRGEHADRYAPEAVARIDALAASGDTPAAFIAEPVYGTAGGMVLPHGYLGAVYGAVRRHGGLAIADEVQVGYGRLGEWFWGFEQQDVVPDIVTVAKAMGNGHPLGAVITSRRIAEAYRNQGYFFSSTGGSPVSSVVGLAVLDALREDRLQENTRVVGEHFRRRLQELAERHPLIGTVHGRGLYLGVELVRDRGTLEPATEETAAICQRMLELGVVVQPTGEWQSMLKVKPPMCMTRESADFFVDTLDHVLTCGW
ncbi:aminotransferase [Actinophytocola sp.]|uniref:aminotransferase n=1 Tax=Actinophytocola sp. TaxID=1872138 RepID=UPI002ED9AA1D